MVNELDCRGLQCPLPIVRLRELLGRLAAGEAIRMQVSTEQSASNVAHFLRSYFGVDVAFTGGAGGYSAEFFSPGVGVPNVDVSAYACAPSAGQGAAPGETVLLIGTRTLGYGDDTLGEVLMKGFLSTLEGWTPLPGALLMLNGGVRLADGRTGPIATLQALEAKGVDMLVCGTCVDFFGLQEHVAVGRISNMFEISQRLSGAARVVRV